MAHLGERLRHRLGRLLARLTGSKRRARRGAQAEFRAAVAALGPGDLAIDLGANLGDVSAVLAASGADVIAFEPDPFSFARLRERLGATATVTLLNAAAGDRAGVLPLYRHKGFDRAPERRSLASSLIADHAEVGGEPAARVEVHDFAAFVLGLGRDVAVVKIDIEGAEVALMEALLDSPAAARIGRIFVETHERALPGLAARTRALKARTRGQVQPRVNWDWH